MDMAIVNAIDRSRWMPPADPWFAGDHLNYYYLGHFVIALLGRATGVDPTVVYNLGVGVYYGLAAGAVFALATTLCLARDGRAARALAGGGLAVAFAMVLGTWGGRSGWLTSVGDCAGTTGSPPRG